MANQGRLSLGSAMPVNNTQISRISHRDQPDSITQIRQDSSCRRPVNITQIRQDSSCRRPASATQIRQDSSRRQLDSAMQMDLFSTVTSGRRRLPDHRYRAHLILSGSRHRECLILRYGQERHRLRAAPLLHPGYRLRAAPPLHPRHRLQMERHPREGRILLAEPLLPAECPPLPEMPPLAEPLPPAECPPLPETPHLAELLHLAECPPLPETPSLVELLAPAECPLLPEPPSQAEHLSLAGLRALTAGKWHPRRRPFRTHQPL